MMNKSFWNTPNHPFDAQRVGKWLFTYIIFLLAYRWYAGKFLMSIALSPIVEPEVDNTFWIFLATGIPELLINNPTLCIIIDLLVFISAGLCYIRNDKRLSAWAFIFLFFIQTITVEAYTNSHSKTAICILITVLPFAFRGEIWMRIWEFARYFLGYIMASSAFSKIYYGGLTTTDQMKNILIQQHTDLYIQAPNSLHTKFIQFIINNPFIYNSLYYLGFITQLLFVLVFITKKYDKFLALLLILFVINTYTLMRIYNMDLLTMIFPLFFSVVYYHQISQKTYSNMTIIINKPI